MHESDRVIVRKYVKAYGAVYKDIWSLEQLIALDHLTTVFAGKGGPLSYMKLECIAEERKKEIVLGAVMSYGLMQQLEPLIGILHKHKRLTLLYAVLKALLHFLYKRARIENILIYSAGTLHDDDKKAIEDLVMRTYNAAHVRSQVIIDERLIAGIRIEGVGFMGDYSVRTQLRNLSQICNKGLLWK